MASELENFRNIIEEFCIWGYTDAKILRDLRAAGCGIGRERLRVWIKTETLAGRLPARKPSGRGRPPATKTTLSPPSHPSEDSVCHTQIPPPTVAETLETAVFAEKFPIPIDGFGRLDCNNWARMLGTASLEKMSDLEFILVESHQKPWDEHPAKWTRQCVKSVRKSAEALREQMLEVAEMHELSQGVLKKM